MEFCMLLEENGTRFEEYWYLNILEQNYITLVSFIWTE
jgi:hypothetical protein